MTRLSPVLSARDLPMAELHALRLDGQLTALDECFLPVDQPAGLAERARSLAQFCDGRLIVEQHSAAWVWGALPQPPARHELCASIGARSRSVHPRRLLVREVIIDEADWLEVAGVRVTTPLRTAVDLARFAVRFDLIVVEQLLAQAGLSVQDCIDELNARRNLPQKKIALARLSRSAGSAAAPHTPNRILGERLRRNASCEFLTGIHPIDVVDGVNAAHGAEHAVQVRGVTHLEDVAAQGETLARRGDGRREDVDVVLAEHARDI
jgi:hypothetical protein